jgi:hypothetical protein
MSTWVLGGERIYDDDDEGSHVLDHSSLSMELGDHNSISGGGVIIGGGYDVVGLGHSCLLGGEQLALEGPGGLHLLP